MSGRNFSLTGHLSDFIDREVASGRHQNASEVVREALRRYECELSAGHIDSVLIGKVVHIGLEAIAKGEFTLVSGEKDASDLLSRLNGQFANSGETA